MEVAMAQDWHVHVLIQQNGREDFVTFQFAPTVSMVTVLPLANASAILDGRATNATSVCHWLDAIPMEAAAWIRQIPPYRYQMDAFAKMASLDICVMSRSVNNHVSQDRANASLESPATRPALFANAMLVGKAILATIV